MHLAVSISAGTACTGTAAAKTLGPDWRASGSIGTLRSLKWAAAPSEVAEGGEKIVGGPTGCDEVGLATLVETASSDVTRPDGTGHVDDEEEPAVG